MSEGSTICGGCADHALLLVGIALRRLGVRMRG
jgi:hypothetical protein